MPTSVGLAIMGAVVLLGFALSAHNSGRLALTILLGLLAASAVGWAIFDWIYFLDPR
jgi:hypothetical protein